MMDGILVWLPRDVSLWHLQRTWLYWLMMVLLAAEMLYFQPRSLRFLRQSTTAIPTSGPWGTSNIASKKVILAVSITSILSILTFLALILASAVAFYSALLGLFPAALRFADEIPQAHTGETIGAAIGSFVGVTLQIMVIIGIISSIDPTSHFPFRLGNYLDQKALP
ncbi:MAG: hypothetical protein WA790_13890 [Sulfitobacter sp.]